MKDKIVGICGLGFVGNAIYQFLKNTKLYLECNLKIYDRYKNINTFEKILESDILFLCLPTNLNDTQETYNMEEIDNTLLLLNEYNYTGVILIKSTVLPNYCTEINNKYTNLKIIHNPEFLSAKTAIDDFKNQKHIILGYTKQSEECVNYITNFYKELFNNNNNNNNQVEISITSSTESALVKLGCNSFYATKIQFFTELFLLCNKEKIDYDNVKSLMLKNEWINPMHTSIPGNDGNISFGGLCFPKDITALNSYLKDLNIPHKVIESVISERNEMRD